MIYITVGTQKFQFNRLFVELDKIIEEGKIDCSVFAQIGTSSYSPKNYKFDKFINHNQHQELVKKAQIIICHAGTSSIIEGLKANKKVIVVPRKKEFDEHVDNHQTEIAKVFQEKNYIEVVDNIEDLYNKILIVEQKSYNKYNFDNKKLITSIYNDAVRFLK